MVSDNVDYLAPRIEPGGGAGPCKNPVSFPVAGSYRLDFENQLAAVGDLNQDGASDIVVGTMALRIRWNSAKGTFPSAIVLPEARPFSVAITDLNRDGLPDLVVPNQVSMESHDEISILTATGQGMFRKSAMAQPLPDGEQAMARAGDLN